MPVEVSIHQIPESPGVRVVAIDETGPGGAHHSYQILDPGGETEFASIEFQRGGVADNGYNGVTNEALLAIVWHRLKAFQDGRFPCPENAEAMDYVRGAIETLGARTALRVKRGVEGKEVA